MTIITKLNINLNLNNQKCNSNLNVQIDDNDDSKSWLFTRKGFDSVLGSYDHHRFAVRGHMERGCRPILKVQFFPGFETKDSMLFTVTPPPTFGKFYLIFCCGTLILFS